MTKTTSSKPGRHCQGPLVDQGTVRGALRNGSSASRRRHRTGRAAREPSRRRTQPPAAASGLPAEGHTGGERGSLPPSERHRRRRQGERQSGNTRTWKPPLDKIRAAGWLRTQKSRSVGGLPEHATGHAVQEEELCTFKVWDPSFLSKPRPLE